MSDKIQIRGDAVGSAVGSGARVIARDITVYKQTVEQSPNLEEDVKRVLKEARELLEAEALSEADKADATEDLGKLTAELEKEQKDPGLIRRYWGRIKEAAPTVASVLSSATSLAKLLQGDPTP